MARLPIPGSDDGSWGDILNAYLLQSLTADGSIRTGVVGSPQLADGAVSTPKLADTAITSAKLAPSAVTSSHLSTGSVTNSAIADGAIAQSKIANLSGDLASKADSVHTHTASQLSDATSAGRTLITAADATAQRTALGLGSAATLTVGTTAGTVAAGDDSRLTGALQASGLDAATAGLVGNSASATMSSLSSTFAARADYDTDAEGRPVISAPPVDADWSGWDDTATHFWPYGFNAATTKIPAKIDGMVETTGTVIVNGPTRRWGLHVFEGWSSDGEHRLTMLTDKHTDYAEIYYYKQPLDGVLDGEQYKWLRLGSDVGAQGLEVTHGWIKNNQSPVTFASRGASAPTEMPDGSPVPDGTVYFNGTEMRVQISGEWRSLNEARTTGLRKIRTEDLTNGWVSGVYDAIRISRTGNLVTFSSGPESLNGASATADAFFAIPSGFRPQTGSDYGAIGHVWNTAYTTQFPLRRSAYNATCTAREKVTFMTSWVTTDAWPSTLPGVAA